MQETTKLNENEAGFKGLLCHPDRKRRGSIPPLPATA